MLVQRFALKLGITAGLSLPLSVYGRADPLAPVGRIFAFWRFLQEFYRKTRYFYLDIHTIQQGAGKTAAILGNLGWGAYTGLVGVTEIAAGAGIHGGNKLKTRREGALPGGSGNMDFAGLQRFPQHFENTPREFRHFIQKMNTMMRKTDFSGAGARSSVTSTN